MSNSASIRKSFEQGGGIFRLAQVDGDLVLHAVRGEAKTPETWEEAGWAPPAPQLPSIEVFFESGESEGFLKRDGSALHRHLRRQCGTDRKLRPDQRDQSHPVNALNTAAMPQSQSPAGPLWIGRGFM